MLLAVRAPYVNIIEQDIDDIQLMTSSINHQQDETENDNQYYEDTNAQHQINEQEYE